MARHTILARRFQSQSGRESAPEVGRLHPSFTILAVGHIAPLEVAELRHPAHLADWIFDDEDFRIYLRDYPQSSFEQHESGAGAVILRLVVVRPVATDLHHGKSGAWRAGEYHVRFPRQLAWLEVHHVTMVSRKSLIEFDAVGFMPTLAPRIRPASESRI